MNGSEKPSLANEILEQLPLAEKTAVWGTLGTIRPHLSFDAGRDAQIFFEAISGEDFDCSWNKANSRGRKRVCKLLVWRPRLNLGFLGFPNGIKYGVVIDLLTNRSNAHRQQIAEAFLNFTQQDLLKMLGAVVSGQLETVITGLLRPATQYDAHEIKAGLQGLETETLIEIASTRTAQQLQEISDYYKQDFKSDLEMDIASGTTGSFKDLLVALIKGKRECYSGVIDYVLIQQDSEALADAAAGGDAGRLESEWIRILTQRSPEHLKRVFSWYHKMTGTPVEETMEKHFQGHFREAGLTLASLLRNAPLYFATKLYQAIKDAGRSPRTAARIMISRSETDLLSIRTEFKRRYGISLYSFIGEETKGDYQAALLGLCKAEDL
ncbi:annexin A9 [Python bivittatus]|uniref:Annexin A9 n=1 Tax=Python bivittatus TaxID=176946 RepID=A0A9F5MZY8_PYTBI|nr:annexin A9 [Python bivittatus]